MLAPRRSALDACAAALDEAGGAAAWAARLAAQAGDDEWLARAHANLTAGCPATAAIVVEQLRRAATLDAPSILRMEFDIAVHCARLGDFREGVRALLIDKDRQPRWRHDDLAAVPAEHVAMHFETAVSPHPLADL